MTLETQNPNSQPDDVQPPSPSGGSGDLESTDPSLSEPQPEQSGGGNGKKMLSIPTDAIARIKAEQRDRGRREAKQEFEAKLETVAKAAGYSSWSEMESAAAKPKPKRKRGRSRPNKSRTPPERREVAPAVVEDTVSDEIQDDGVKGHPRVLKRLEAENARLLDERRRLNRSRAHEERRRRQIEREFDAHQAEAELRVAAAKAGVQDVDYALHLLRREMQGKTAEELEQFDESAYFSEKLRQKHPYLYATETVQANTGPDGSEDAEAGPSTGQKSPQGGDDVDARKMSRDDYHELLRKRGFTDPSVGMPG